MRAKSGIFVTFEGTEGAGKSTLILEVEKLLKERGFRVVVTREPGGSPVAERIRRIILEEPMDPWAELLLYEASRAEHVAKTVRPALERGDIVLCDRFTDSSLAYQGFARGLPWKEVKSLNQAATRGLKPDLTIFLDIDPATGLARARDQNRFEAEGVTFQTKVRSGFLKSRKEGPKRWYSLKAGSATPAKLGESVVREISRRFKRQFQSS